MKQITNNRDKVSSFELKKVRGVSKRNIAWPIKVLILTFCLSAGFSVFSEIINSKVGVVLSLLIIVVFFIINVAFDVIGVATTVCEKNEIEKLNPQESISKKIAFVMINNNEKVCSFCCDIIGDICGILSGSAGASLIFKFHLNLTSAELILLSTLISAIIASITVFAKALGKRIAIKNSSKIVFNVGKLISVFFRRKNFWKKKQIK